MESDFQNFAIQATKTCTGGNFINPTPTGCSPPDCTSTDQTYKCKCKNGLAPIGCICPNNPQDLTGISIEACECRATRDPRAGDECPITRKCNSNDDLLTPCLCSGSFFSGQCTCSTDYHHQSCVCDSIDGAEFELSECQASKKCTPDNTPTDCTPDCSIYTDDQVPTDSCMCFSNVHSPFGCRCPQDPSLLGG
ncbi:MAG: hypothetical protein EZS28_045817, partial [Streblomastix strix]